MPVKINESYVIDSIENNQFKRSRKRDSEL